MSVTKLGAAEVACMVLEVIHGNRVGIPRHVEEKSDGIFHRLEVAHVKYP